MSSSSPSSLRGLLLRRLMVPILGGILLVGGASYVSTRHEAVEIYDAEQVHFSKVLLRMAQQLPAGGTISFSGVQRRGAYERYVTFRIWKDGKLFLQSSNAQGLGPVTQAEGFTDRMIGEMRWRFYVEKHGSFTIEVAERDEVRLDMVRHILGGIFLPQLIIIPVIAIIISFGISRGLQPVERLSQRVRRRNANQLAPMPTRGTPRELLPMVDAINDLMGRVDDAMRIEKNFTNYAAHEMRTPIAALKTQAQVILRTPDVARQKQLAAGLLATIDRTQRIIEQLLTYARVQHQQAVLMPLAAAALLRDEMRLAVPRALARNITLDSVLPPADCIVMAQEELLRLVLANLLDNAIKYIPDGGRIEVALSRTEDGVAIAVRDDGPGIAAADLPYIFDPFYRVAGNGAAGAGLGLAIVKWACDLQHIRIAPTPGLAGHGAGFILTLRTA